MKTTIVTLAATAALTGCGSVPGRFDNVLTVSLTGDRAFVSSLYGRVGVTAELRKEDAAELQRLRQRARDGEELARMVTRGQ